MANVIIVMRVMPTGLDVDLKKLEKIVVKKISNFDGGVGKVEHEPVAFGLVALKIPFVMDENRGDTEELEKEISEIDGVNSVNVIDVRRAIG